MLGRDKKLMSKGRAKIAGTGSHWVYRVLLGEESGIWDKSQKSVQVLEVLQSSRWSILLELNSLSRFPGNKIYGPKFPGTENYKAKILRKNVLIGTNWFILGRDSKMVS